MSKISNMKGVRTAILVPPLRTQLLNQAAPVQDTWYTVGVLRNVEVEFVAFRIATTGETLGIRVTIDGVTSALAGIVAVADTDYPAFLRPDAVAGWVLTRSVANDELCFGKYQTVKARTFLFEIRKTTNVGAGNLRYGVAYQQW